ncbi:rna-directed dna polymerase from mobile element jockey-like [Willisornis vidua]|uniref:Rna-directed dna polymerase from mobile element jockey-like n=1 Tax=Willisornis vidua TaxID=1566151 RepID=A0ABQ9D8P0_9PASS|nr:rna-directed dna polymerase from mobile element jockey-like [Willisornis vidua]
MFCGVVNTLEGRDAIQRELDRLERWVCANLIKFNKAKCEVLNLSQVNPKHEQSLGSEQIKSSYGEKDLGVLVDENLNMTLQFVLATQKTNCILSCIKRSLAIKLREVILPLYSALGRPDRQYCGWLWGPQHKDMDLLESREGPRILSECCSTSAAKTGCESWPAEEAPGRPYSSLPVPGGSLQ